MAVSNESDPTFRSYSSKEAKSYSAGRQAYPKDLYETILRYHQESDGRDAVVLDVGCGPGRATRDLARFFDKAIGIDPGVRMIEVARQEGGTSRSGQNIDYHVSPAENISEVEQLGSGQVDLLTAAAAVHWFDMAAFWEQAAQVVRPGGTVALWTTGCFYCHPSTPNASEVNNIMRELEGNDLAEFELPPNRMSRMLYSELDLPWHVIPPSHSFAEKEFRRLEWDRDGVLSNGDDFFGGSSEITLDMLEHGFGTASTVTRWRTANPALAHTADDCVVRTIAKIRQAIGPGSQGIIRGNMSTALLLFKRR